MASENFSEQISNFFRALTSRQRILLVVSVVVVIGTLWLFVWLFGKANYKTLYTDLPPGEASRITRRLDAKRIPYQVSQDGSTVSIPSGQINQARLDLASEGIPPVGSDGWSIFDKNDWNGTPFTDKVNYQRALQGELERSIQFLRDVESARVHLVLPPRSIFTEREREAKAAVIVKLRSSHISDEDVNTITHLVASSVDNLKPENVTVVNADGNVPLMTGRRGGAVAASGWPEKEEALSQKIVDTLAPVVGVESVKASVTVELDPSSGETTSETYDPERTVLLSSDTFEERMGGTALSGIPGTFSNVPGAETLDTLEEMIVDDGEYQIQRTEGKKFGVSKRVDFTVRPAGMVKRITTAVLVDDVLETEEGPDGQPVETRRKRTVEEMNQLRGLAMAAIGYDEERGDQFVIQNISFRVIPVVEPVPMTGLEQFLFLLQQGMGLLRYVALFLLFLLVYLLLLRPIKKQVLVTFRKMPSQLSGVRKSAPALAAGAPRSALAPGAARSSLASEPPPEGGEIFAPGDSMLEAETSLQNELASTSSEVKRAVMLKKHLADKVKKEPQGASRLIQNWIRGDEARR